MEGPHAQDVSALLVAGDSTLALLAGTNNGDVFGTDNPATGWKQIGTIRNGAKIHRFILDPEKPATVYAATDAGLFVSANRGASWMEIRVMSDTASPVAVRSLAIDPWNISVMYAGTTHKGIRRSSDGGMTWNPAGAGIPGMDSAVVHEILIDRSRPDRVLAAVSPFGVVLSSDAGTSWTRLTEEYTSTGSSVTHLAQDRQAPATIVYGTDAGSIRKSTDGGATWSPSREGSAEGVILSLAAVPDHPGALLAGTESGIVMSNDFGASWTDITGTLPHLPLRVVPSADGRIVYAFGEGIGVQQTNDIGATWTHVDRNLGGATVRFLATDEQGGHLYAALEHSVLAYDSVTSSWESASSGLVGGTITSLIVDSDSPLPPDRSNDAGRLPVYGRRSILATRFTQHADHPASPGSSPADPDTHAGFRQPGAGCVDRQGHNVAPDETLHKQIPRQCLYLRTQEHRHHLRSGSAGRGHEQGWRIPLGIFALWSSWRRYGCHHS